MLKIVLHVARRPCSVSRNIPCCQVLGSEASVAPCTQVAQNLLPLGSINLLNLPTLGSVPLDTNLLGVQVCKVEDSSSQVKLCACTFLH
jgi:hypothetical protein